MFHKLNDYCWTTILEYLDLKDQISVGRLSKTLKNVVRYHWQNLKTANLDEQVIEYFTENPKEMEDFLHHASKTVENMRLDTISINMLAKSSRYAFPKLIACEIDLCYGNVDCAEVNAEMLNQMFPSLRCLSLRCHTPSHPLSLHQLPNLRELNLIYSICNFKLIGRCLSLRKLSVQSCTSNIYSANDLQPISNWAELEELFIDDYHLLGDFLYNLLQMPKLRRLGFYTHHYYDFAVEGLAKLRPLSVKSLLFHDSYRTGSHIWQAMMTMKNLERFALVDDDIETCQLYMICTNLPNLKELHLTEMRSLPSATQLWNLVAGCKTLWILNLSGSHLGDNFVEMSLLCLDKVFLTERIISPFTLCLYNSSVERIPQVFNDLKHPHLKVSYDPVPLNVCHARFAEALLTTSADNSPA